MDCLRKHFRVPFKPVAKQEAIVMGPNCRFTVLAPQLIRMEYDPANRFEDRASQVIWYRDQPVPEFTALHTENTIDIETDDLHLKYDVRQGGFTKESLQIRLKKMDKTWQFGDEDEENLLGTARTLDGVDGKVALDTGLLSKSGWSLIDDSRTLVFNQAHWLERRFSPDDPAAEVKKDFYFFGYGHEYLKCLQDFCKVSGRVPLLPRWVLGNWWSRYWAYTQDELKNLMLEFEEKEIPLSVCIIDMDWHIVQNKYTSGWTGYTWNRDLFPEPDEFIAGLHSKGLKTALNLHPASGVHPHEEQYQKMAEFMGIDPESEEPVEFNIADPKFIKAYFEILHHPMEDEQGVDFWWMDWQQGTKTRMAGLDPLWALNHLHFYDRGRDGKKRPFIFSRWAGLGNHRYPIGFSGDTIVSWDSLDFQPYFTATASNVAFGWWSHDIGGHMFGQEEPELYARWVQFGIFSPIMRLHSTKDAYLDRRPWGHGEEVYKVAKEAMQFRHALIPYLYTMSWRNYEESIPLITPMYYHYPEREEAYSSPNQYYFGSELLVAPYVSPKNPETNLSRQVVWLPEGEWFDFWNGEYHVGDRWYAKYGKLDEIPVFAKAGAIVPLGPKVAWGGIDNPDKLEIYVFPGADNFFQLFEDDGDSLAYKQGGYAITTFSQKWGGNKLEFVIHPAAGDKTQVPTNRDYALYFRGVKNPDSVEMTVNGQSQTVDSDYNPITETLLVEVGNIRPDDEITVTLAANTTSLMGKRDRTVETCRKMLKVFRMPTKPKEQIESKIAEYKDQPNLDYLRSFTAVSRDAHIRALVEVLSGVGVELIKNKGPERIIMWNNQERDGATYQMSAWKIRMNQAEKVRVPRFKSIKLDDLTGFTWKMRFDYFDLVSVSLDSNPADR